MKLDINKDDCSICNAEGFAIVVDGVELKIVTAFDTEYGWADVIIFGHKGEHTGLTGRIYGRVQVMIGGVLFADSDMDMPKTPDASYRVEMKSSPVRNEGGKLVFDISARIVSAK